MITAQDRLEINQAMTELSEAKADLNQFSAAYACPVCYPHRFDGGREVVPQAVFCWLHRHGELARIYRALGIVEA